MAKVLTIHLDRGVPGRRSMTVAALRERIGEGWVERADGWWLRLHSDDVRAAARAMLDGDARFAALVACSGAAGGARLCWQWDVAGTLLSVEATLPAGAAAPSIADLYPGADWAEREAHDCWAVAFSGRPSLPPVVRREGEAPGPRLAGERRP